MIRNLDRIKFAGVSGIYLLFSTKYCYVGSATDLYKRINNHVCMLGQKRHHNSFLQRVFNKDPDSYNVKVLEVCPSSVLEERETYYFELYRKSDLIVTNIMIPYRSFITGKLSEEHRKNISISARKNFPKNKEVLLKNLEKARLELKNKIQSGWKQASWNKGTITPDAVRLKQSISAKKRGSTRQYMSKDAIIRLNQKISLAKLGSKSHFAKLNELQVLEIKNLLKQGNTGKRLSEQFSISEAVISQIKNNQIWTHVQA